MGTASSSQSHGGIITLPSSRVQATVSKPAHETTEGALVLCDGPAEVFNSPQMRRVADAMAAKGNLLVFVLDMSSSLSTEKVEASTQTTLILEEAVHELRKQGARRIGLCGFGMAADVVISVAVQQRVGDFAAAAVVGPTSGADPSALTGLKIPLVLVLAGRDDELPKQNAADMVLGLSAAPVSSRVRSYRDQRRGFVDKEATPAGGAAISDIVDWFRVHLPPLENWRVGTQSPSIYCHSGCASAFTNLTSLRATACYCVLLRATVCYCMLLRATACCCSCCCAGKLLARPPSEEDWWPEGPAAGKFVNVGLATWETAREKWKEPQLSKR